jgi:hypothetical protein
MNWDAIGAIGELLGAAGVIASLVYLALQIRQNSHVVQSSIIESVTGRSAEQARFFVSDRRLSRVVRHGLTDPDKLDDDDVGEFLLLLMSMLRDTENVYYQYRQGLLPEEAYHSARNVSSVWIKSPLFPEWWASRKVVFHPTFREFVEATLKGEQLYQPFYIRAKDRQVAE